MESHWRRVHLNTQRPEEDALSLAILFPWDRVCYWTQLLPNILRDWLASLWLPSNHPISTHVAHQAQAFLWVLGICTQVLRIAQQIALTGWSVSLKPQKTTYISVGPPSFGDIQQQHQK